MKYTKDNNYPQRGVPVALFLTIRFEFARFSRSQNQSVQKTPMFICLFPPSASVSRKCGNSASTWATSEK